MNNGELSGVNDPFEDLVQQREAELRRAYQLGLLHGINAQSMTQAKRDVMAFEDYGWTLTTPDPEHSWFGEKYSNDHAEETHE